MLDETNLIDGLTTEEWAMLQTPLSEVPKEHMHAVLSIDDKRRDHIQKENEIRRKELADAETERKAREGF